MTNKINGIDVSECPLFDKKTGCYHTFNGECVKDSCALYKWLLEHKHLQQELDIKEKMLDKFMIGSGETLEKLQKENEELKNKKDEYYLRTLDYEAKISYLIQALEEITLIIDELKQQYDYMADYSEIKEIEDKINEVLNDRD